MHEFLEQNTYKVSNNTDSEENKPQIRNMANIPQWYYFLHWGQCPLEEIDQSDWLVMVTYIQNASKVILNDTEQNKQVRKK